MSEQRPIDANAFYKQLEEIRIEYIEENTMSSIFAAEIIETVQDSYLKDAPTIDPVRHGKWIDEPSDGAWTTRCTSCNSEKPQHEHTKWCPDCGAKMDGEK